jgi:hypothetical protein
LASSPVSKSTMYGAACIQAVTYSAYSVTASIRLAAALISSSMTGVHVIAHLAWVSQLEWAKRRRADERSEATALVEIHYAAWVEGTGALATVGALWFTGLTVRLQRGDRRRELEESQRHQADQVAAWIDEPASTAMLAPTPQPGPTPIALANTSSQPVYDAIVRLVFKTGGWPREDAEFWERARSLLSVIPPGEWSADVTRWKPGGGRHPGVEIAFTDRAGRHWLRTSEGKLTRLAVPPLEHYGLTVPGSGTWRIPARRSDD